MTKYVDNTLWATISTNREVQAAVNQKAREHMAKMQGAGKV